MNSNSRPVETNDYSDEDYEDNFDDAGGDNAEDEMEKLRKAMEKEKLKAN